MHEWREKRKLKKGKKSCLGWSYQGKGRRSDQTPCFPKLKPSSCLHSANCGYLLWGSSLRAQRQRLLTSAACHFMICGASLVAQTVKNLPAMQEDWFAAPGQEDPLEKGWNPLQYSCLENPMDRGAWRAGYSLWVGHDLHLALGFYCLTHFLESAVLSGPLLAEDLRFCVPGCWHRRRTTANLQNPSRHMQRGTHTLSPRHTTVLGQ